MLPFDVDGKEPLHFNSAAADGGSEWFSLAVAEEKHLKDMGVVNRHTTSCHLPIAVLQSKEKKARIYLNCFLAASQKSSMWLNEMKRS